MLNEFAIGVDRHRAHLHIEANRAAARELPPELPVRGLVQDPFAAFEPGVEHLGKAVGVELMIRNDRALLRVEARRN